MAEITKLISTKERYCVCDKCGKEQESKKTLSDAFMLQVVQKWHAVPGTVNGWLCNNCLRIIVQDWYREHQLPLVKEPLFNGLSAEEIDVIKDEFDLAEDVLF